MAAGGWQAGWGAARGSAAAAARLTPATASFNSNQQSAQAARGCNARPCMELSLLLPHLLGCGLPPTACPLGWPGLLSGAGMPLGWPWSTSAAPLWRQGGGAGRGGRGEGAEKEGVGWIHRDRREQAAAALIRSMRWYHNAMHLSAPGSPANPAGAKANTGAKPGPCTHWQ
jgi:hypothetical protein